MVSLHPVISKPNRSIVSPGLLGAESRAGSSQFLHALARNHCAETAKGSDPSL